LITFGVKVRLIVAIVVRFSRSFIRSRERERISCRRKSRQISVFVVVLRLTRPLAHSSLFSHASPADRASHAGHNMTQQGLRIFDIDEVSGIPVAGVLRSLVCVRVGSVLHGERDIDVDRGPPLVNRIPRSRVHFKYASTRLTAS
jgi:hypothetical protein